MLVNLRINPINKAKKPNITEKSTHEFSSFLYKIKRKRYNRKVNDEADGKNKSGETEEKRNQQDR